MSTIAQFSIAQYDRILSSGALDGRRLELIEGEIREMSPIGPIHENVLDRLARWSFSNTDGSEIRVRIQQSIELSGSAPEPDLAWVTERDYSESRPNAADVLLLIEVADSSVQYDLGQKASLYATEGIADYWVVDVPAQAIVIHREPMSDGYGDVTHLRCGHTARPLVQPSVGLEVSSLFADGGL